MSEKIPFEMPEPIFKSTEGKDLSHLRKRPSELTREQIEHTQSLEVDSTESQEIVDHYSDRINELWNTIKSDKQLRGILAHLVRGDFTERDSVSVDDLRKFYKLFPSEESYMKNEQIGELLKIIKDNNSTEKYQEYNNKAIIFVDLMFSE